ncbi:MAG: GYD domain-containing protein [Rubrobacteraceae bacterium]
MPTYMSQFSYTNEALKALVKQPEDRGAVFREQVEKLGGKVIAFYHCMGEYDGVTIYEVPDKSTASALDLAVRAPGHLKEVKTTELHTVETAMEGMRKASERSYRGPLAWLAEYREEVRKTREQLESYGRPPAE